MALDFKKTALELPESERYRLAFELLDSLGIHPMVCVSEADIAEDIAADEDEEFLAATAEQIAEACGDVSQWDWSNEYSAAKESVMDHLRDIMERAAAPVPAAPAGWDKVEGDA